MQECRGADGEAGRTGLPCGTHPAPWAGMPTGFWQGEAAALPLHGPLATQGEAWQAARCLQVP